MINWILFPLNLWNHSPNFKKHFSKFMFLYLFCSSRFTRKTIFRTVLFIPSSQSNENQFQVFPLWPMPIQRKSRWSALNSTDTFRVLRTKKKSESVLIVSHSKFGSYIDKYAHYYQFAFHEICFLVTHHYLLIHWNYSSGNFHLSHLR